MYWNTESQYQRGLGGFKALLKFKTLLVLEVKEVLNPPLIPPLAFINRFSWQHLSQKGTRFEQPLCFSSGIRPPLIPPLENKNHFSWQNFIQRGTRSEQPLCFSSGLRPPLIAMHVLGYRIPISKGVRGIESTLKI